MSDPTPLSLEAGEDILHQAKPHLMFFAYPLSRIGLIGLFLFLLHYIPTFDLIMIQGYPMPYVLSAAIALLVLVLIMHATRCYRHTFLIITNQRVFFLGGWHLHQDKMLWIERIEEVNVYQSTLGRIQNQGVLVMNRIHGQPEHLYFIQDPFFAKQIIDQTIHEIRHPSHHSKQDADEV